MRRASRIGLVFFVAAAAVLGLGCPNIELDPEKATEGPYDFGYSTVALSDGVEASIFYPVADEPVKNAPVIIFSSGWNQLRMAYFSYGERLAKLGYVTIIRFYPSLGFSIVGETYAARHVDQIIELIDWCEAQTQDPASPYYQMMDANAVGLTGHSLGGAVSVIAATYDERVKAVVSLDGNYADDVCDALVPGFDHVKAPMMFIGSTMCTRSPFDLYDFYSRVNPPAMDVTIPGSDHMDFMDEECGALCEIGEAVCGKGTRPRDEVHEIATRYMLSWFNLYVRGDQSSYDDLYGKPAEIDDIEGRVEIQRKQARAAQPDR